MDVPPVLSSGSNSQADVLNPSYVQELSQQLQQSIADVVRQTNALPKLGKNFELYASFPNFMEFMRKQRTRIIAAMRKLIFASGLKMKIPNELDDIEHIVAVNDSLIERIAILLDDCQANVVKTSDQIVYQNLTPSAELIQTTGSQGYDRNATELTSKNDFGRYAFLSNKLQNDHNKDTQIQQQERIIITKPQRTFQECIDNSDAPFIHKLRVKHNMIERRPLNNLRLIDDSTPSTSNIEEFEDNISQHPYQYELDSMNIADQILKITIEPKFPIPIAQTRFIFVNTINKLQSMVTELNSAQEFAFDVEHHDLRSFLGITCLLQISTADTDYVIDPFPVWNYMYLLNEPFSNPKILKVAHAADNDVLWLQRDFGIYVLNLFDTKCAMRVLNYSRLTLKHLIEFICNISLDKKFQRSDWRTRPLSEEMIAYARNDTHYLLYCYNKLKMNLRNKTIQKSSIPPIQTAFSESHKISYMLYEQPRFNPNGFLKLLGSRWRFNNRQLFALKELWKWRDAIGRDHDESLQYVLPDHMMLQIAEVLPKETQGILACCSPIPPLVKNELQILYKIVRTARDLPLEKGAATDTLSSLIEGRAENVLADPTLEGNIISKLKAKLEYHFDCTDYKADDPIPSIENGLIDEGIVEIFTAKTDHLFSTIRRECNERKTSKADSSNALSQSKIGKITNSLSKWASPYESYLLSITMLKDKEKQGGTEQETSTEVNKQKRQYSHLDNDSTLEPPSKIAKHVTPVKISEMQIVDATNGYSSGSDAEYRQYSSTLLDSQILTKKARKRMQKIAKKSATFHLQ